MDNVCSLHNFVIINCIGDVFDGSIGSGTCYCIPGENGGEKAIVLNFQYKIVVNESVCALKASTINISHSRIEN